MPGHVGPWSRRLELVEKKNMRYVEEKKGKKGAGISL